MKRKTIITISSRIFSSLLIFSFVFTSTAYTQNRGIALLRDAEIEQIIRDITEPIFEAAGLEKEAVSTYLVNDNTLNAFVAGGQNVFIHSGLLLRAENVNQVMGVVAHETGHITGGHLHRFDEGLSQMANYSILGVLLGAAAIAAGSADAGMAAIMGGQHLGYRSFLRFSRTQESSADQAGLIFLEKAGQSGKGFIEFLEILGEQDLVPEKYQDPYASTHPITSMRVERIRESVQESPFLNHETDPELEEKFRRLQAKLFGYLKPLHATLVKYPLTDKSVNARYARTFAYQQKKKIKEAIAEIDGLIEMDPENPFFYETKGQILYEDGRVVESLAPYKKAVEYLPTSSLLRMSYAQSLISSDEDKYLDEAIENLEISLKEDPLNSFGWRQASIAYHRSNNEAMTHYATAQHFLLSGNIRGAMINAKQAVDLLPKDSPMWYKAQDIMMMSETNMEKIETQQKEQQEKEDAERRKDERRGIL